MNQDLARLRCLDAPVGSLPKWPADTYPSGRDRHDVAVDVVIVEVQNGGQERFAQVSDGYFIGKARHEDARMGSKREPQDVSESDICRHYCARFTYGVLEHSLVRAAAESSLSNVSSVDARVTELSG